MLRRIFNSFAQVLGYVVIITLVIIMFASCAGIAAWCSISGFRDSLMQ